MSWIKQILLATTLTILFIQCDRKGEGADSPENYSGVTADTEEENTSEVNENEVANADNDGAGTVQEEELEKEKKDCSEAYDAAEEAYTYSRRANNTSDYEEGKDYLRKAMRVFSDAETYANDCDCDQAASAADDGYNYAKKGYEASDFEEMIDYARKAKNEADDVKDYAESCNDEYKEE